MMKATWIVTLTGLLVGLAGCSSHQKPELSAKQRWADTRGQVLSSVAEEQYSTGDVEAAKSTAQEALALSPELLEPQLLLARVNIDQGKYVQAADQLDKVAQAHQDDPRIPYLQAVVAERRQRYPEALKLYEKARALDGRNQAYVLASAEVMVHLGRAAEALALVEAKLSTVDPTPGMHAAAGRLASLTGRHDRAAVHYANARALQPGNPELQEQLAKAYFFAGQYASAITELQSMTQPATSSPGAAKPPAVWMQTMLAESYLAVGQGPKAKAVYMDLTRREPRVARHWIGLAKAALEAKDDTRAAAAARQALAIEPGNVDAAVVLGYALLRQGQGPQANAVLAEAAKAHPENTTLLCLLGRSYQALGQADQAAKCFQAVLAREPGNPVALKLAQAPQRHTP